MLKGLKGVIIRTCSQTTFISRFYLKVSQFKLVEQLICVSGEAVVYYCALQR